MKKTIIILFVLFAASNARADNFGCTVMLCLVSPGGPMQFAECRPTIKKLYNILYNRGSFPSCQEAEGNGLTTKKGTEPWVPCADGYDTVTDDVNLGVDSMSMRVCRKVVGYREVKSHGEGIRKIPVYDQYNQQMRPEPHYVEVWHEGAQKGERFWYKIKRKKKKGWF